MGVYMLNLTTRSRKVPAPDGTTIEVFTYKFSHKASSWELPRHVKALQARLANVWARRGAPDYVCWSEDFAADTPVYAPGGCVEVTIPDAALDILPIVGYLRGAGRQQRFEPWHKMEVEVAGRVDREALAGLLRGPWSLRAERASWQGEGERVAIYARDAADLAAAKLALA